MRILALLLLVSSCQSVAVREVSVPAPAARIGVRGRLWEVRGGGERLGLVVLFQERGLARDCVYIVRNAWHQDLGLIDGLGRAYRYLPHVEEPVWVGSGTVALGTQRILGLAAECELLELVGPELECVLASLEGPSAIRPSDSTPRHASLPTSTPFPAQGLPSGR